MRTLSLILFLTSNLVFADSCPKKLAIQFLNNKSEEKKFINIKLTDQTLQSVINRGYQLVHDKADAEVIVEIQDGFIIVAGYTSVKALYKGQKFYDKMWKWSVWGDGLFRSSDRQAVVNRYVKRIPKCKRVMRKLDR